MASPGEALLGWQGSDFCQSSANGGARDEVVDRPRNSQRNYFVFLFPIKLS